MTVSEGLGVNTGMDNLENILQCHLENIYWHDLKIF